MSRRIFHKLVSIEEALNTLSSIVRPLGTEEVDIDKALGRVLAEDITSPITLPPFDRSSVDGYAIRAYDVFLADEYHPIRLMLKGNVNVGEVPNIYVNKGEAVEVATGAMIPPGANAVIMEEFTHREGDYIVAFRSVSPGENIYEAGTDFMPGEIVFKRGIIIGFKEIGILSSLGIKKIRVFVKPKVAIISTGNEIKEPGTPLELGQIYDINGFLIKSLLETFGCEVRYLGIVPDDYQLLRDIALNFVNRYDLLLFSGGTSAGREDLVYRVLEDIGDVLFHGLRTKPGKPTVVALVNNKLVIGLPGHPVSAAVVAFLLVIPVICKMSGCSFPPFLTLKAKISRDIPLEKGKLNIIPVALINREELIAYPTFRGSGLISSIWMADGLIKVFGDRDVLKAGEEVQAYLLPNTLLPDLVFIGSNCPGAEILLHTFSREENVYLRLIYVGSTEGLLSVIRGEADIAGVHLLDPISMEYNMPYLRMYKAKEKVALVKGYLRTQGLIVAKGNPKGIRNLKDLLREDIKFINRNKGSGTRILLDIKLQELASELGLSYNEIISRINGYHLEVRTHTAVASAIAQGKADVGLGVEYVARLYNLDFIPIAEEEYDFLIPKSRLSYPIIKHFLSFLSSNRAREILMKMPGIKVVENTGEIINM